ncbi:MAG: NAD(P)/FAD-dependent oxidoreductase [Planctomycetota bacterium]|jgi:predicted NAD/FAD-binding protein
MRIAIVGSGISGMVAAYHLQRAHEITVFEANDYVGGHTNTVEVRQAGRTYAVDTGFIVFNDRTYPNFERLLSELGVAWQPTEMSFSVKCERTGLEYNGSSLNRLFAQRRNLLRPSFYRMLRDVLRFNREAPALLEEEEARETLGAYVEARRYSREFVEHYLVPMGAAIWSTDPRSFREFPARTFVRFFSNHGLLTVNDRPEWRVVQGGSARYVERLTRPFRDRIRLRCPVAAVHRRPDHVVVRPRGEAPERFDEVIFATHSDQALRLLADPTPAEREILGALRYQRNEVVLHTDARLLPRRRAWASWNYHVPRDPQDGVAVTYHMNILQSLQSPEPFLVTLNRSDRIDPDRILRRLVYDHPVFDLAATAAQERWAEISGVDRTHYCGAYWGYGFHEDGVKSGLRVCESLGRVPCRA